jgi:hypothetical protein
MSVETGFCPRIGEICKFRDLYCQQLKGWTEMHEQIKRERAGLFGKFEQLSIRVMPWFGETPLDFGMRTVRGHIYDKEAVLNLNCNVGSETCIIEQHIEANSPSQ